MIQSPLKPRFRETDDPLSAPKDHILLVLLFFTFPSTSISTVFFFPSSSFFFFYLVSTHCMRKDIWLFYFYKHPMI